MYGKSKVVLRISFHLGGRLVFVFLDCMSYVSDA